MVEKIAILMATYNGERFLSQQLDSFTRQTHKNWDLYVSDDGSKDQTLSIIDDIKKTWADHTVHIQEGPHLGFAANFLSMICNPAIEADYYACSDQDDIWVDNKFEHALLWFSQHSKETPLLYCSRTHYINDNNEPLGYSYQFKYKPKFQNALVQNIAGGNTMIFNHAAKKILEQAGSVDVEFHDWWMYQAISACGGIVHYDAAPQVLYRQHLENIIGSNMSWHARIIRIGMLLRGDYRVWNERNAKALSVVEPMMSESAQRTYAFFQKSRAEKNILKRSISMAKSRVYRQTILGNLGLAVGTFLNKN